MARKLAFDESAVTLPAVKGEMGGTLTVPRGVARPPLAIIIAGSGPTSRDGNSVVDDRIVVHNDCLKQLAQELAARGVASVRYDKRGLGGSKSALPLDRLPVFEDFVEDAEIWARHYTQDDRFSAVFLAGHSEGSLVAMLAARKVGAVAGVVSLNGAGRPVDEVLREQIMPQLARAQDKADLDEILGALRNGKTVDVRAKAPVLRGLFNPAAQPYFMSWCRYDPAAEIRALGRPVLVVQGTTDIQIPFADGQRLAQAGPGIDFRPVCGMNHIFKRVSGGRAAQAPSYNDPALPIHQDLGRIVADFIRGRQQGRQEAAARPRNG